MILSGKQIDEEMMG
jgi:hypothetical protein